MSNSAKLRDHRERKRAKMLQLLKVDETERNPMKPNDTPSVPSVPSIEDHKHLSAGADPRLARVVALWNEVAHPDFGKVKAVNSARESKIRSALKVLPELEDWRKAIQRLNSWPHAHGQSDTGWVAGFDYLLSNDKHGNSNLLALAEGAKGGAPKQDVRTGHVRAEDQDFSQMPLGEIKLR